MDASELNIYAQLFVLVLLTGVNAFFACAEIAIVSVNKNKMKTLAEEGNKKAKLIIKMLEEPTRLLSTIQVAITLSGFFASAFAATNLSMQLGNFLSGYRVPYSHNIAVIVITVILSYFTLVFGELVPKRIALQKANSISLFVVKPVVFMSNVAAPFIKLLSFSTNVTLKILGMHSDTLEEQISEEEIKSMLEVGKEIGVFDAYEQDLIESIFEFDDTVAREVMTARQDVYCINIDEPLSSYIDELLHSRHSRIPVYKDEIDNIIGILYIKDFIIEAYQKGFNNVAIETLLQEPYFVPETKYIDLLFKELQSSKKYMSILIDEYGGFAGIVTVEDLVEEVMGPIDEEGQAKEPFIEQIERNTYRLHGLVMIDDLSNKIQLPLPDDAHDTVSGLLIDILGSIPENPGQQIEIDQMVFIIEKVVNHRIEQCLLKIQEVEKKQEKD